ncbi:MAG: stage II sporulation protein M [bacterium]|nr:stage II sporulation protein M [bacterium]
MNLPLLLLSAVLFLLGMALAIPVCRNDIRMLLRYPLWIFGKLEKFLNKNFNPLTVLAVIFIFNSISLLIIILSGILVFLPFVLALFTGLNVGIIGYKKGGLKAMIALCCLPHAWVELPAAWISMSVGMQFALDIISQSSISVQMLTAALYCYLTIVLPLLLLAAIIETVLIWFFRNRLQHTASLADEPFNAEQRYHHD